MDNRNNTNYTHDSGDQAWQDLLNSIPDYPELGFLEDSSAGSEPVSQPTPPPQTVPPRQPSAPARPPRQSPPTQLFQTPAGSGGGRPSTPTPASQRRPAENPDHLSIREPMPKRAPVSHDRLSMPDGVPERRAAHETHEAHERLSAEEISRRVQQRAMLPLDPDEMPAIEPEQPPSRQPRMAEEPPRRAPASGKRKRRKGRGWFAFARGIFTLLVIILISVWLSRIAISAIDDYLALYKEDTGEIITVEIPEGASTQQIAALLEENGVINNAWFFRLICKLKDSNASFHSGEHTFGSAYSYTEIIDELQTTNARQDTVTVTIPEGFTIRRMAERLEENGVCDVDELIAALDTVEYDFEFWDEAVFTQELRYYLWEGYLFPDTYEFYTNEDPEVVLQRLLANFENRLTDDYVDRAAEMGMSVDQLVTLASIIQAESSGENAEVMAMVSSVFHNRMNNADEYPQLQSDPTGYYVRDYIEPYLAEGEDPQAYYDVYDTYVCNGLPIGPITNPGLAAIEAALSPADTDYFYFVTDANGQFYWAETLAEHEANIATAQSVNDAAAAE